MILIEKTKITGLEPAIRGMRNPMNSWERSDSGYCSGNCDDCGIYCTEHNCAFQAGPNDRDLMKRLAAGGPVHAKYRRMIAVYVDITAPLYWWKEFDTYKVGTVANSCSTMHKIHAKEFSLEDFSHEHLFGFMNDDDHDCWTDSHHVIVDMEPKDVLELTVDMLNKARDLYLGYQKKAITGDQFAKDHVKEYWWQMIQLLPSTYNQKRTVMLNYEVLSNIYQHRRNHKLDEWRELCRWIENLPYSEIITCNAVKQEETNSIMAAVAKLKGEQWSTEDIVALLLGQTKKEQLKSFADSGDDRPVHGGIFDIPDLTVGDKPKES